MADNHIIVAGYAGCGYTKTRPAFQHDYGQVLQLDGFGEMLPNAFEMHFSIGMGKAITRIGSGNTVEIPNVCFEKFGTVTAWLFLHDTESDGETKYVIEIPVRSRAKATDQEPTTEEQSVITETIAALNAGVTAAEAAQSAAEDAQAAAEQAQGAAETAKGEAETAQGKAEDAQSAAETAQSKAEDAQAAAEEAQGKAEDAQEAAETAQGKAEEAQAAAEAAVEAYDAMTAEATTLQPGSSATAEIDHFGDHPVLLLGLPQGATGSKGDKGDKGDPGSVPIDDTAGAGDTTKVWSADKTFGEFSDVKSALNQVGNMGGHIEAPLFEISSNIADITNLANGYIKDDGTIGASNAYHYTQNYIKVIPGETYAVSGLTLGSVSTYKADKTFIERISYSGSLITVTMGSNVQYVRISGSGTPSGWRMNRGTSIVDESCHIPYLGEYVSLKHQIDDTLSESGKCADAKTTGDAVAFLNTAFEISPNIADTTDVADGYIKEDGTIGTSTAYHYTQNYIDVKPGKTYSVAGLSSVSKYGISKNFIERILPSSSTITLDENTYYVRLSSNAATSNWRMNEGSTLYDHPYHLPYLGKDIEIYYQEMPSKWAGKTYAAIGDSITAGFIPRNDPAYPGTLNSYAKLTAQKLGMTYLDYGISGSSLAYVDGRSPMCRRYTDMSDDADLITFMGGANDIRNGIQLGTMSDRTDSTYYGALHVLLGGLYKKYMIDQGVAVGKTKKIVALTPIKLLDPSSASSSTGEGILENLGPWAEAVKEVAAYYSIPVFDMYNLSSINPHLDRTVHGTESGYTGYYNPYITDGTHPNQAGQEIMADALTGFLETLL